MNEKIKALWNEAAKTTAACPSGQNNSWETQVNFIERFAHLVVEDTIKEICQQMHWHGDDQSNNPAMYKSIEKTLKEFGL